MQDADLLREAADLLARGESFALATVVRRTAPSSARPGQKALVLADGSFHGWLGGACIEPTVRREALGALRDGRARLVVFAPGGAAQRPDAAARPDTVVYPMTCHSGGTVEIYVEPQHPAPVLALFGDSPINRALAGMGRLAGYAVRAVGVGDAEGAYSGAEALERLEPAAGRGPAQGQEAVPGRSRELWAVVATMGEWDEDAVEQALAAGARYVGLVASPRRAAEVREILAGRGVDAEALGRLVSPAGLDLGAVEPGEIAITILAQVVERRRRRVEGEDAAEPAPDEEPAVVSGGGPAATSMPGAVASDAAPPASARDPVCGMEVETETARHTFDHEGARYYFCCDGCRRAFAREPRSYLAG